MSDQKSEIMNAYKEVYFPKTIRGPAYCNVRGEPLFRDDKVIGAIIIHEEITVRVKAQQALKKARSELEQRVEDRTAELTRTNALLNKEIEERKQAERERERPAE